MDLLLSKLSYAVFDLETTGLYPEEGDEIVEIGAVLIDDGAISSKTFQMMVNPKRPIPAVASKISGITDADVADAPTVDVALTKFMDFVSGRIWVAQNAKFDMSFVAKKMRDLNRPLRQSVVLDTIGISKILFPYETSHNLDVLMSRMGVVRSGARHRSLDDSRYTAQVLIEFIKLLEKQGLTTLPQIETAFIKLDALLKTEKPRSRSLF